MRQIVLDTETTGLGAESGHRIIEIGCVELVHRRLTGNHFHVYLNPQREIEDGAFRVHGISTQFLQDKPLFKDIVHQFIDFIDDSELIIHNAPFDVAFINVELKHCSWPTPLKDHCGVVDTLVLAREKHPGQRNTLDALCKRYEIDNSKRTLHGALLDAEILALVYLAMTGGQGSLFNDLDVNSATKNIASAPQTSLTSNSPVLSANAEELKRHEDFIRFLVKKSGVDHWLNDIPNGS